MIGTTNAGAAPGKTPIDVQAASAHRAVQDACEVVDPNRRIDPKVVDRTVLARALAVSGD